MTDKTIAELRRADPIGTGSIIGPLPPGPVVVMVRQDQFLRLLDERAALLDTVREVAKEPPGCDSAWLAKRAIEEAEKP